MQKSESRVLNWEVIQRPAGPQPLPDWIRGAKVRWMDGWGNAPGMALKVFGEVRDWPGKTFVCENGNYRARHPDGRMEQYAHSGPVSRRMMQAFRRADGIVAHDRRYGPEWGDQPGFATVDRDGVRSGFEPGEWTEAEYWATTPNEGFGGRVFWVNMEDGREIGLCGPWHVGSPNGYSEFSYLDVSREHMRWGQKRWHDTTFTAGLYLKDELAIAIYSRFLPHIELARVTYRYHPSHPFIEPMKPEWDAPKAIIQEREGEANRARFDAARAAAQSTASDQPFHAQASKME